MRQTYSAAGRADVLVRLEEDDVDFGNKEAAERHGSADVDANAKCGRLDLMMRVGISVEIVSAKVYIPHQMIRDITL